MMWVVIQILRRAIRVTKSTTPMDPQEIIFLSVEIDATIIRNVVTSYTSSILLAFCLIVAKIQGKQQGPEPK